MIRRHTGIIAACSLVLGVTGCHSLGLEKRMEPGPEPVAEVSAQAETAVDNRNRLAIAKDSHPDKERYRTLAEVGFEPLSVDEIGYYMDTQEARFRQEFAHQGILIERDGDTIRLVIPGITMFEKNSDRLSPGVKNSLVSIARVLSEYNQTLVAVEGFTDNTGGQDYNQHLSEQRALSAGNYLAEQGVDIQRLIVVGCGEKRPLANNSTEQGRAANRRIELTLYPITVAEFMQAQL